MSIRRAFIVSTLCFYFTVGSVVMVTSAFADPPFPNPTASTPVTYTNNLVLTGNQVMTIDDKDVTVDGWIEVRDSAHLIIRQSIIKLNVGPPKKVKVFGAGRLTADTTVFGNVIGLDLSNPEAVEGVDIEVGDSARIDLNHCFAVVISCYGQAKGAISNSHIFLEPLGALHVEEDVDVLIEDSVVGSMFLPIPDTFPVTIDNLAPGYFNNWSVDANLSPLLSYDLVLIRTTLKENTKGYKGGIEMGWGIGAKSTADLTISNSRLNKLSLQFPVGEYPVLSDLRLNQPVNFSYAAIRLINTEITTQWRIGLQDAGASIYHSEGIWLWMDGGNDNINLVGTNIGEIDPRGYTGTLLFSDGSSWCCGYEIFENSHINIEGEIRMFSSVPIFDSTSTMTRYYDVYLLNDLDGSPRSGIPLVLSKDSSVVWSGTTDQSGKVGFPIVFDIASCTDDWILSALDTTINMNKEISIFISNPVKISLEPEEDGVHFRPVVHVANINTGMPFGTRHSPYTSIQEAILNIGSGTIRVGAGAYNGYIAPGEARGEVSLSDNVVLLGAGADRTTIAGTVVIEDAQNVYVSGFNIEDGIDMLNSDATLTNNLVADYAGFGIIVANSTAYLFNNTLARNDSSGINMAASSVTTIVNNIIVNNATYGIQGTPDCSTTIDYNDVFGNPTDYIEFFPAGPNDISLDPLFVNTNGGDYRLQGTSPCINAGDPDSAYNDCDGTRNDMGAFGGLFGWCIMSGIGDGDARSPGRVMLFQNYPNPFNGRTSIGFYLPQPERVTLTIYDVAGRHVRTLVAQMKGTGLHTVDWNGKDDGNNDVSSGIYMCRLKIGSRIIARKAVYLK